MTNRFDQPISIASLVNKGNLINTNQPIADWHFTFGLKTRLILAEISEIPTRECWSLAPNSGQIETGSRPEERFQADKVPGKMVAGKEFIQDLKLFKNHEDNKKTSGND